MASCADERNTWWAGLGEGTMDRTILAGIRVKTFVKSEGIGFNEQADRQPHWGHTCCVYEKISDGQAGTDSFFP